MGSGAAGRGTYLDHVQCEIGLGRAATGKGVGIEKSCHEMESNPEC